MPTFDRIPPSPAIGDLRSAKIALVTSGGIVPLNNPDRIEAASASKFAEYNIAGVDDLTADTYQTCHGGYDPTYANDDPDRILPIDALRTLEKAGIIGKMHDYYYVTVGNATSIASSQEFGKAIAEKLKAADVDGVILTSTWGTDTRCGATLAKEIDRAGLPVVHVASIVPISLTVGANRIVPAVAIPHPLGNPVLPEKEESELRLNLVKKTLRALQTEVDKQTVFEE